MPASPKICDLSIVSEAVVGRVLVDLLCDGKSFGEISAYSITRKDLASRCRRDFARATRQVGLPLEVYAVFWSKITARLRGTGVGTALYLAAAEGASRLGGVLVQHACYENGTTSNLARNVWAGARFREHALVFGDTVAYMPKSHWGAARSMLRYGQIDVPLRSASRR